MSQSNALRKSHGDAKSDESTPPVVIESAQLAFFVPIKTLSPDYLQELAEKSKPVALSAGQYAFKQGNPMDRICYLLRGKVELANDLGESKIIVAGTKTAALPLDQGGTHQCSAKVLEDSVIIKVDPNLLDIMLTWEQSGGYEVQELKNDSDEADHSDDWMSRLLQAQVFHRIPPANIQSIFMRMEAEHFSAGDVVIKQGDEGDKFYLIREGYCKVVRQTRKNPDGVLLAKLSTGDNFGEEALISGGKRNASIIMLSEGVLMSLSKSDFLELMNEPLIHWLGFTEAKEEVARKQAVWIDVRLPTEYQTRHLRGSINIPLPILRAKLDKLDADGKYIICCDTGRRSSTATYLLSQNGIDAYVLKDGLRNIAQEEFSP